MKHRGLAVVIMAAGKGTRMKNPEMAKVMYTIDHHPMIDYVVHLAQDLQCDQTVVIVGWKKETVVSHLKKRFEHVICVEQSPQLGWGGPFGELDDPPARIVTSTRET